MNLVTSTSIVGDNRGWLCGPHGTEPGTNPSIDIDASTLPAGTKSVPSGAVMGRITASGKFGLYDPEASDGRQVAAGLLFDTVSVTSGAVTSPNQALLVHGFVDPARLPIKSGAGSLDAKAKTALTPRIHFGLEG